MARAKQKAEAQQQAALANRTVSVAPASTERFLPGLHNQPGEGTYQSLLPTARPGHVYEQINARTPTPSAAPHRDVAASESGAEEPHYEFGPADPVDDEHDYEMPLVDSRRDESYGGAALGEVDGEEPHYEFAPQDPAAEEHIYDTPSDGVYETPAPSGLGSLNGLGVYLVNGLQGDKIPNELKGDLQTALVYADQLDRDIGRAATLLGKMDSPGGALTETERHEVNSLIGSNKHNLAVVQSWLVGREEALRENGSLTPETRAFFQALQTRIADRHMDLADLTCLYDLDEASPDQPVSREDRCNAHLLDAEAAVAVARGLQGVDPAVKDRLVADLEHHRDLLINVKDAAGDRLEIPGDGRLALAGKELWETPRAAAEERRWQRSRRRGAAGPVAEHRARRGGDAARGASQGRPGEDVAGVHTIPARRGERDGAGPKAGVPIGEKPGDQQPALGRGHESDPPRRCPTTRAAAWPWTAESCRARRSRRISRRTIRQTASIVLTVPSTSTFRNLAQTTLTNSSGEVLFSGFRHGVLDAYDIDAEYLASLPDANLRTMIGDLLAPPGSAPDAREAYVEEQFAAIRSDPKAAQRAAETMRGQASREMASEMAVAALVADPEKLQEALDGDTVDVALSSISLLTPDSLRNLAGSARSDERTMLNHQTEAMRQLAARNPVELRVRDAGGALRTVSVNVQLRQFNFGVNAGAVGRARVGPVSIPSQTPGWRNLMGWGFAMERNNPQMQRLFGGANVSELGGDVGDRLYLMRREAEDIAVQLDDIEDYMELRDGEDTSDLEEEAAPLRAQQASLNKRIESLDSAARQAKAIWASNDYRAGGGDPFKMVSRLALVGHLMGETPLFNCKSGKDRTGQLDAEVKFLATAADQNGGTVPAPDESMEAWRGVRSDFVFNTGNLEMQRLNTGMPGYKLKGVPGLANVIRDGMKPLYRGGSAYVAA